MKRNIGKKGESLFNRRMILTMSATQEAVSNLVGKSSFLMCEFTEVINLFDFER